MTDFEELDLAASNRATNQAGKKLDNFDIDALSDDILTQVTSTASFTGQGAKTSRQESTAHAQPVIDVGKDPHSSGAASAENQYVTVAGKQYLTDSLIKLDHTLVLSFFGGNKRDEKRLRNIDDLAAKIIKAGGNTQPVLVRPTHDKQGFEVVAGMRRTHAYRLAISQTDAELTYTVIIKEMDDTSATNEAAMENLGREKLDIWELGDTLQALLDNNVVNTVEELKPYLPPEKREVKRNTIYAYLTPARIPEEIRRYIDESMPASHANAIKLKKMLDDDLTVSIPELNERMKDSFRFGHHSIHEVMSFIKKHVTGENAKERGGVSKEVAIQGANGPIKISFKISESGKFRGDFDDSLSIEDIAAALEIGFKALEAKSSN